MLGSSFRSNSHRTVNDKWNVLRIRILLILSDLPNKKRRLYREIEIPLIFLNHHKQMFLETLESFSPSISSFFWVHTVCGTGRLFLNFHLHKIYRELDRSDVLEFCSHKTFVTELTLDSTNRWRRSWFCPLNSRSIISVWSGDVDGCWNTWYCGKQNDGMAFIPINIFVKFSNYGFSEGKIRCDHKNLGHKTWTNHTDIWLVVLRACKCWIQN